MTNKRRNTLIGAGLVGFAASLWGFDGVFLTPKLSNLDVVFVVFALHLIPFLFMNLFFFKDYKCLKQFNQSDYMWFFLIALTGGAIGTIAIVKALFLIKFQALSVVVLLQKLQPVFAILLAIVILGEKPQKKFYGYATIALIASYFLTFGLKTPSISDNYNSILAIGLSLLAAFSFGASTVFSRKVLYKYPFQVSTFFRYGFSSLVLLLFFIAIGDHQAFEKATATNWLYIGIISATTGSGAIFIYYYGLKKIKASVATFAELMFPVSAVFFDYIINGKVLSLTQWFAAVILLISILKISTLQKKE